MADLKMTESAENITNKQEISIQVSLNGFSIYKRDDNLDESIFNHHSFASSFSKDEVTRKAAFIFEDDEILKSTCHNCRFIYLSQKSVLIPEEFFDPNNLKKLFEFNQNLDELDELHYSYLPKAGIYNVFTVPNYLASIVSNKYPLVEFHHQGSILIKAAKQIFDDTQSEVVLVNINRSFFDLVIYNQKGLALYNSFEYANKTDFIYFFLYALKQLGMESKELKVILIGEASDDKGIKKELGVYTQSAIPIEQVPLFKETIKVPVQFRNFFCLFNH